MGKLLLISRLVGRDLRFRPAQAVLLLLAITAATTVLSLALALHGVTQHPYQQTRAATRGPDVVALFGGPGAGPQGPGPAAQSIQAQTKPLVNAPGVAGHGGPYPVASAVLQLGNLAVQVQAEGRSQSAAAVDQPKLTAGSWVRPDGIVLERTFAAAMGASVGDRVGLNGRRYTVTGIAVTAASAPFPNLCYQPGGTCVAGVPTSCAVARCVVVGSGKTLSTLQMGLAWVTEPDARALASRAAPLAYVLDLRLEDPATAQAFAADHDNAQLTGPGGGTLVPWQSIAYDDGLLVQDEQQVLTPGAWLAGLLAVASVAVLAGGRMADHGRRIGLLKAVGCTPGLVAVVLLAENLALALLAAGIGLAAGWLAAPLITSPGAGLVGTPGAPSVTAVTAAEVIGVALVVALAATLVPAIRGARSSTVSALADTARPPRRRPGLIAISRRLPVPLMLGMRLVARWPRRAILGAASVAVTTTGIVAVLTFHATADGRLSGLSRVGDPVVTRDEQMLLVITVALLALAVLNAITTAWATVVDATGASALARALGATKRQLTGAIAAAQLLPAVPGAILGVPLGLGLFVAASGAGANGTAIPSAAWLIPAVLATLIVVTALTAIPAWAGARRPVTDVLAREA
ncbi:MAG TPA: ABC transporter permease [Streptosporangiaceae bacterium]|jgi:putative ABC transport system permease protein